MAVILCPWCQSEIPVEEGQEPDRYCPVCDNEIGGYRTLRIDVGGSEEDSEEEEEDADADDRYRSAAPEDEGGRWADDGELTEKEEDLLRIEEAVEALLDKQETVPECPQCREYMLETGVQAVGSDAFAARVPDAFGGPIMPVPFELTMYVCPSCFTVHYALSEPSREELSRRLIGGTGR